MDVWIGTSGYSYADWRGPFYPAGLAASKMLAFYSRHFPLVELNFTFYRPPTPAVLQRMADQTPQGFQFIVKLPRALSHDRDPRELPGFRAAVEPLRQRGRLAGLLCQLPQSAHDDRKSRAWIETLAAGLAGLGTAVEFRHRSWARPEVPAWLLEHGLGIVSVDVPDLPALFPRGLVTAGPTAYVRLHSRNAGNWYAGDKARYDYDYSDVELGEWAGALRGAAGTTERAMVAFNNCWGGQAVVNAARLAELLRRVPGLSVVAPPADPGPEQRSLFD